MDEIFIINIAMNNIFWKYEHGENLISFSL
jgi:hypothetical protein